MVTETSRIGRSLQLDSRATLLDRCGSTWTWSVGRRAALKGAAASKYSPKK
jgi:hypothetical protein